MGIDSAELMVTADMSASHDTCSCLLRILSRLMHCPSRLATPLMMCCFNRESNDSICKRDGERNGEIGHCD